MTIGREEEGLIEQFLALLHAMSSHEVLIAGKQVKAYDSNITGEGQKMFRLFNLLKKGENSYVRLKEKISPEVNNKSFNRLIRRTLYRVQESLIVDVNINRKGMYQDLFRKKFELRKRIMQAHILLGKGLPEMAYKIFSSIVREATQYELYDELIEALLLMQPMALRLYGWKRYDEIEEQITFYHKCRDLLQKTKNIHKVYSLKIQKEKGSQESLLFLEENLRPIITYLVETGSTNIESYYLLLKMEYYFLHGRLRAEERTGVRLIRLLINNKTIYSRNRIAIVYNKISDSMYSHLHFKKSSHYLESSLHWIANNKTLPRIEALDNQINCRFFLMEYKQVEQLLIEVNKYDLLGKYPVYQSRMDYKAAMNHFVKQEYREAFRLLSNLKAIEKDKDGWNVWIRIMRILCSIELLRLNLIDYDVESFRKYIQRIDKQYEVRKRDKLVLKVLIELDRQSYNFDLVFKKREKELKLLASTDREVAWDPKSPEMILFHDWFFAKKNKGRYSPNFEPYLMAWDR
jgi:hypothetical protein